MATYTDEPTASAVSETTHVLTAALGEDDGAIVS